MKKIYIIGIVLALVFSITGCGIRETKNADKQESTVSTETKRQEPLRIEKTHKDGITYIQEQYLQYQIKYLAMDKKVISEEKVKEFMLKGYVRAVVNVLMNGDVRLVSKAHETAEAGM